MYGKYRDSLGGHERGCNRWEQEKRTVTASIALWRLLSHLWCSVYIYFINIIMIMHTQSNLHNTTICTAPCDTTWMRIFENSSHEEYTYACTCTHTHTHTHTHTNYAQLSYTIVIRHGLWTTTVSALSQQYGRIVRLISWNCQLPPSSPIKWNKSASPQVMSSMPSRLSAFRTLMSTRSLYLFACYKTSHQVFKQFQYFVFHQICHRFLSLEELVKSRMKGRLKEHVFVAAL